MTGTQASNCTRAALVIGMTLAGIGVAHSQVALTRVEATNGTAMTHAIPANYVPGLAFLLAGGAAGDFNSDGWQDLYVISGGTVPDRLFINNGDGTFTNRAAAAGITVPHMGGGIAVGDYDRDGWLDIYVTSFGPSSGPITIGKHILYHNNRDGTFTDVAQAAGVHYSDDYPNAWGACFGDYDLDGDLDLWTGGWLTGSLGGGNRLFRNNGDGTFSDATVAAGVLMPTVHGFGARIVDMDGDRFPELLVCGDFYTARYYLNNHDGTFTDYTTQSGTGLDCNAMGATIGDFDNDQRPDWYVTNIYRGDQYPQDPCGNMLYMNQGNHQFVEQAALAGVNDGRWGWGTAAVDLDHDGWQDIVEVNGYFDDPFQQLYSNQPKRVWFNNADGTFSELAAACGFNHTGQARGVINLDADNDGDQDLVVLSFAEPLAFYRNDGPTGNWLRVFLDGEGVPSAAPNGFGSRVVVRIGATEQVRYIDGGSNYLSQSELSAHFGLGAATQVDELRVEWPNGILTTRQNLAANQTVTVRITKKMSSDHDPGAARTPVQSIEHP